MNLRNSKKLIILGNGNVSLDIAWLLAKDQNQLENY